MRRRSSNVVPFRRPQGTATPRRARRKSRGWRPIEGWGPKLLLWPLFIGMGWQFVLIPVVDYANGLLKPMDGCQITRLIDGDTLGISCAGKVATRARLIGFDTPEMNAECWSEAFKARAATYYLRWLLLRARTIEQSSIGVDRYDRDLIRLIVDGVDVADLMIGSGLAKQYDGGLRGTWCET